MKLDVENKTEDQDRVNYDITYSNWLKARVGISEVFHCQLMLSGLFVDFKKYLTK